MELVIEEIIAYATTMLAVYWVCFGFTRTGRGETGVDQRDRVEGASHRGARS